MTLFDLTQPFIHNSMPQTSFLPFNSNFFVYFLGKTDDKEGFKTQYVL